MKKKLRRLRLDRETIRNLTPDHLNGVVGGTDDTTDIYGETRYNSCDLAVSRPISYCNSCRQNVCG